MAEYIERRYLLAEYDRQHQGPPGKARELIANAPTADVAPVRHGRWIVSRTDYGWNGAEYPTHCKCSMCGREIPYQDQDHYCPRCGARMDGGEP